MENKTALEVVNYLNEKLYGVDAEHTDNFEHHFEYRCIGTFEAIALHVYVDDVHVELQLWNSESSIQYYLEDIDDYEPIETIVLRAYDLSLQKLQHVRTFL